MIMKKYDKILVSIVMPNYNGAKYIIHTIKSVLSQTHSLFELIIVDDCSTDNSIKIIQEFQRSDKRISLIINKTNQGVSQARNIGIKASKGKYIALIDNDDTWEPEKIAKQLLIAENGADIVFCSYGFIDKDNQKIKKDFIVPEKATFKSMLTSSVISCSTAFIRKEIIKNESFTNDYYHEDYVMWMNLLKKNYIARGEKKVLMHYRQTKSSRSNRKFHAARERWIIYRKALNLRLIPSIVSFVGYALNGIKKYWMS